MATINSFEEIEAWKMARKISKELFNVFERERANRDYGLKDQINRSSGSIMDNIAEGFERGGNKELIQFLFMAKGSAGEARSQLYRVYDRKYISEEEYRNLFKELLATSKLIMKFIQYLKNSGMKGNKFNNPEN